MEPLGHHGVSAPSWDMLDAAARGDISVTFSAARTSRNLLHFALLLAASAYTKKSLWLGRHVNKHQHQHNQNKKHQKHQHQHQERQTCSSTQVPRTFILEKDSNRGEINGWSHSSWNSSPGEIHGCHYPRNFSSPTLSIKAAPARKRGSRHAGYGPDNFGVFRDIIMETR